MTVSPIPPTVRLEQQVRTLVSVFYSGNGTGAHSPAGMRTRSAVWAITGRKPTLAAFEEALEAIHERDRINSNSIGLWDGTHEVWPNSPDYAACKSEHLEVQDQLIDVAIRNLIPGGSNEPR